MLPAVRRHHEVFYGFKPFSGEEQPRCEVDFLGCKIRHEFWPAFRHTGIPERTYPPFNEQYFEWISVLESVVQARENYTMIELGAGFGRWMVRAAVAMRQLGGLPCHFLAVEPEPLHFSWIPLHFQDNGIDPGPHKFVNAAVSDRTGDSDFYVGMPSQAEPVAAEWYGQALVKPYEIPSDSNPGQYLGFPMVTLQSGYKMIKVRTISLVELLGDVPQVDLLDLDIQEAELKVISSAIEDVTAKVKRLHIGTHTHEIEAGLRALLPAFGWECIADYPCLSESCTPWGSISFNDGVQSWLNPRFQ